MSSISAKMIDVGTSRLKITKKIKFENVTDCGTGGK